MKILILTDGEIFYGGYSTLAYKIYNILNEFKLNNKLFSFIFSNKGIADNEINLYGKFNDNRKIYSELEKKFSNTTFNKIICTSPWAFYISSLYFKQEILYIKGGGLYNVENLNGSHILNANVDDYLDPLTVKLENNAISNTSNYKVLPTVDIMYQILQKTLKIKFNKKLILSPLNFAWFENNKTNNIDTEKEYDLIFIVSNHDRIIKNSNFVYKLFDKLENLNKIVIGKNCEHFNKVPNTTIINKCIPNNKLEDVFKKSKISITSSYFDTGPSTLIESIMNGCISICYHNCGYSQLNIDGCYTMDNLNIDKWIEQIKEILNNYNNFDILKNSNKIYEKVDKSQKLLLDVIKL
jgi:glycosyltransferase involved in cell wall biosynthesis